MNDLKTDPSFWVENYADVLYAFALKKVFSTELAKDLVQETFLAGLESFENFKGQSSVLTWLTSILRNKIVDAFRKNKLTLVQLPNDRFFEENGHWKNEPLQIGHGHGNPLENKELGSVLKECMDKLPANWLAIFSLKYMEESSAELICETMGISMSNYWVIIHRSKLNLRQCLQKKW